MDKAQTERQLAERAAKGDEAAFEALVKAYEAPVYQLAYRAFRCPEDAMDISQEVFWKLYQSLPGFRGDCGVGSWIYRIAVNTIRDAIRKKGRQPVTEGLTETDEDGEERFLSLPDPDPRSDPSYVIEEREQTRVIREAIAALPEEQQTVLILRDLQGYRYEEIAEMKGIEPGTVKSRIHRGRNAVKEWLRKRNLF